MMALDILPLSEFQTFSKQKCLIPENLFPKNIPIGSAVICTDSKDNKFVCKLFPSESSNYCVLGNEVQVDDRFQEAVNCGKLMDVRPVDWIVAGSLKVQATLIVNENVFKLKDVAIDTLVRELLHPYILSARCRVQMDKVGKELGISEIALHVKSCPEGAFQLQADTEIVIENVKLSKPRNNLKTDLHGFDEYSAKLKCLLTNMEIQHKLSWEIKPSLNALIVGSQGSGKTSLCRTFLTEFECNTFEVNAADVMRQFPGETEEALREIFRNAKKFVDDFSPKDPTVIYIEDIDLLCPAFGKLRSSANDEVNSSRITGQLISLIDDLHATEYNILIIATTVNIESLDTSLRRPGRFNNEIALRPLSEPERAQVLTTFARDSFISEKKDMSEITDVCQFVAKKTPGYVGADLLLLVQNVSKEFLRNPQDLKEAFENVLKNFKPASVHGSDVTVIKSEENFSNIGGMQDLKKTLEVSILAGLKHTESYLRFNLQLPKGILLYGPPGCAKTTIAKCLASEANMTFIATSGAEVYSPYVGNAEKFISKIFDTARKNAPCLIFLDEIDTLVGKRTMDSKSDVQTRILSTLLTEMDGIGVKLHSASGSKILVVAATNRPDMLDDALLRPGRFDRLIHVPAPDFDSRIGIFNIFRKKMPFSESLNIPKLAEATHNFSGADICNLCNEAAMHAFTRDFNADLITCEDFDYVLKKSKPSLLQSQIDWYFNFENKKKAL